jgi:hypothetical protein
VARTVGEGRSVFRHQLLETLQKIMEAMVSHVTESLNKGLERIRPAGKSDQKGGAWTKRPGQVPGSDGTECKTEGPEEWGACDGERGGGDEPGSECMVCVWGGGKGKQGVAGLAFEGAL